MLKYDKVLGLARWVALIPGDVVDVWGSTPGLREEAERQRKRYQRLDILQDSEIQPRTRLSLVHVYPYGDRLFLASLPFLFSRMNKGSYLISNRAEHPGTKRSFEEFLKDKSEKLVVTEDDFCYFKKL